MPIIDKEKKRIYKKEYRERNLEKVRQQSRDWNRNNRARYKSTNKKWYEDNKDSINFRCRKNKIKREYYLTIEQYNQMFVDQNGVCAICGEKQENGKNLSIDHNHETGKVRGLLCTRCNTGIGLLKEKEDILLKAIEYLKKEFIK